MTNGFEPVDLASLGLGAGGSLASLNSESLEVGDFDPSVSVYLDPVCPYSYLAFDALFRIVDDLNLSPTLHPLLLAGSDPMLSAAESKMHAQKLEAAWPGLRRAASSTFGIELQSVPWGARGAVALEAVLWAGRESTVDEAALWRAIFEARFRDRQDIDDAAVMRDLISSSQSSTGAANATMPDLGKPKTELESRIATLRREARQRSITSVPTTIFGGGHVVVGAQPESVLRETLLQLQLAGAIRRDSALPPTDAGESVEESGP